MIWLVPLVAAGALLAASAVLLYMGVPLPVSGDIWVIPFIVGLAFAASTLASMVGLGGGLIISPVLILLGIPPPVAAASSLAATLSNAAGSSIVYASQRRVDYPLAIRLGLMAIPGSILGAVLSSYVESRIFGILLAVALATAVVYVFMRPKMSGKPVSNRSVVLVFSVAASFGAGVVSSFFGVGGGVVFVPLMVVALGMSMSRAAPVSMFALLLTSIVGILTHSVLDHTDMIMSLLLSVGALAGGMAGARLSVVLSERYLRTMAALLMIGIAFKLVWDATY